MIKKEIERKSPNALVCCPFQYLLSSTADDNPKVNKEFKEHKINTIFLLQVE